MQLVSVTKTKMITLYNRKGCRFWHTFLSTTKLAPYNYTSILRIICFLQFYSQFSSTELMLASVYPGPNLEQAAQAPFQFAFSSPSPLPKIPKHLLVMGTGWNPDLLDIVSKKKILLAKQNKVHSYLRNQKSTASSL